MNIVFDCIFIEVYQSYNRAMPPFKSLPLISLVCLPMMAADLAPTGTLRATFLGDNPVQGTVDSKTGAVSGPVADIVKELARREGVLYKIIPAASPKEVIESLKNHTADIGFLAWEAERARQVDFSGAYLLMGSSYLVPAESPIKTSSDADRAGVLIGAVRANSPTIFLNQHLKNAKVKEFAAMPPLDEVQKMLTSGELAAFAGNRARLVEAAAQYPSLRVAQDNFTVLEQNIVVEKGDTVRLEIINKFLNDVRASSFVKDSLTRAKLVGVEPATNKNR
jgi:polar amino acid transport system substrate-binding protein